MPSTSPKQAKTMMAAAHSPEFAKKVGIPQEVAEDYYKADKKKKRGLQGLMAYIQGGER